jgi:hypothetical protein
MSSKKKNRASICACNHSQLQKPWQESSQNAENKRRKKERRFLRCSVCSRRETVARQLNVILALAQPFASFFNGFVLLLDLESSNCRDAFKVLRIVSPFQTIILILASELDGNRVCYVIRFPLLFYLRNSTGVCSTRLTNTKPEHRLEKLNLYSTSTFFALFSLGLT